MNRSIIPAGGAHPGATGAAMLTDEQILLKRVRANDADAIGALYDQYAPAIYAYVYRRVGEQRLAEDLTADVFVRALEALRKNQFAHTALSAWLYRLAHNRVIDHYRRQRPQAELDERHPGPDDVSEITQRRTLQHTVRMALRDLTEDQQHVLVLRFGEGKTAMETARLLNKTEEAVRALQHRSLAALLRLLEGI
ncbi:MAG: sigma-70 family RNA polymerase sigma factor [Anaerolineales bacterium]